jgi:hypothetical protein
MYDAATRDSHMTSARGMDRLLPVFAAALVFLFASTSAQADGIHSSAGERGFKFLQVNPDARTAALGDGGVASSGSAVSIISNPAGLADVSGFSAAAGHAEWLASIRNEYLGMTMPAWGGGIGVALRMQSSGDIPLRTVVSGGEFEGVPSLEPFGTYGVHNAAVTAAYSRRMDRLLWGVAVTAIHEKIYLDDVTAFGIDAGVIWAEGPWRAGAAIRNVGLSGDYRSDGVPLPWDIRVGGSYTRPMGTALFSALLDVRYAPDWHETAHAGVEAILAELLALRIGYRTAFAGREHNDGLTAGTGVRLGPVDVDYAYIPTDTGLGSKHLFTLSYSR